MDNPDVATNEAVEEPPAKKKTSQNPEKYFYVGVAVLFLLLMFWGFQLFYTQGKAYPGRELTPPIKTLLILHGVGMTLWMILFVVQTSLVATGNRLLHMRLGKFGVVVAVFTFIVGFQLAIASGRFNPPEVRIWDLSAKQFMAVSLFTVVFFAAMVAIGLWKRRKPAIHRTFMVLSMLSVMPPILDRIDPIKNLYINTVFGPLFGPFFSTFVLGLLILIVHWALTRKIDRVYAIGYAVFFVGGFISMRLAPTAFWERISNMLAG